jgi:starch synthase
LQVYFLDNEDFFKRKYVFNDEEEKWYDDNDLRTIFFCKGALETVKKFGWPPDVIHCSGWMTALIPLYLKTVYKKEPVFANSKVIYTLGSASFEEKLSEDFAKKALIHNSLKEKDLDAFKDASNYALQKGAAAHADAITFGSDMVAQKLIEEFSKVKGKKVVPFKGWDSDLTEYLELYNDLAGK